MQVAIGIVDTETAAQRVKASRRAGKFLPRDGQRINHLMRRQIGAPAGAQFGIDEFHVESGIMGNQRRIADKGQKRLRHFTKDRLVFQKTGAQTVHRLGFFRHVALGIDIDMKRLAAGQAIDQLETTYFDDAVAIGRVQPGGFRIKDNLTHWIFILLLVLNARLARGICRTDAPLNGVQNSTHLGLGVFH